MGKNNCNGCTECCTAFPLLPNPDFWPEGKKAHEPCRFLKCHGCGIHDRPRPSVCTDFTCGYLECDLPPEFWPKTCKVIVVRSYLKHFFGTEPWNCFADLEDENAPALVLVETEPRVFLAVDARRLRYWISKKVRLAPGVFTCLTPYGVHNERHKTRRWYEENVMVHWTGSPDYAEEVYAWWVRP